VSPELKVYTISDREALSELVAGLRLDWTLASNLREVADGWQWWPTRALDDRELAAAT